MNTQFTLNDITNNESPYEGTGIFDTFMKTMIQVLEDQHQRGRMDGADYAKVFLGISQSVLSESIRYSLEKAKAEKEVDLLISQLESQRKNNEDGGILDKQREKLIEEILLVKAQTASQEESVAASKADTVRRDALNEKELEHRTQETELVETQKSELELNGAVERSLNNKRIEATTADITNNTKKTDADVNLTEKQILEMDLNGATQRLLQTAQKEKTDADTVLTSTQKDELVANNIVDRNLKTKQIDKTQTEINLVETQRSEMLLDGTSRRNVDDAQVNKITADINYTEGKEQEMYLDGVSRRNIEASQVAKNEADVLFTNRQENELLLSGVSKRALEDSVKEKNTADKEYVDVQKNELLLNGESQRLLVGRQKEKVEAEILLVGSQAQEVPANAAAERALSAAQTSKADAETILLGSRNLETIAATVRSDNESTAKVSLMETQAVGFKTDAKQKLLRLLYEGYGINVTTLGEIPDNAPASANGPAIDAVANDILDDFESTVGV